MGALERLAWLRWLVALGPKLPALIGYIDELRQAGSIVEAWEIIKGIVDLVADSLSTSPLAVDAPFAALSESEIEDEQAVLAAAIQPMGVGLDGLIAALPTIIAVVRQVWTIWLSLRPKAEPAT